jgi:hypothetical protein
MSNRLLAVFTLGIFILLLSLSADAQWRKVKRCQATEKAGKYKLFFDWRPLDERRTVSAYIIVKPKNINRKYLLQVARRLKSEYCYDEKLNVIIFDDIKLISADPVLDYANSDQKIVKWRGLYSFDRATGKESFEFSTKLGNPTNEVQVDLSTKPPN